MGGGASKPQETPRGKENAPPPEKEETKPQSEEQLIEEVLDQIEDSPEELNIEQVLEKVPDGDKFVDTELETGVDKVKYHLSKTVITLDTINLIYYTT